MPSYTGKGEDFRRFFGPFLRNLVQQLTKKHKASIGKCQHCGAIQSLEAAHVRGRDRGEIINVILKDYSANGVVTINLREFEKRFRAEHHVLDATILILCTSCHRKYDAGRGSGDETSPAVAAERSKTPSVGVRSANPLTRTMTNAKVQQVVVQVARTLSVDELEDLCSEEASKRLFGLNFALFKKIPQSEAADPRHCKALKDHLGINRWTLKHAVERHGFLFAVTTQWYERHDLRVRQWLIEHGHPAPGGEGAALGSASEVAAAD